MPCLVMATVGTTSSLAVDPVDAVATVAEAGGHVAARGRGDGGLGRRCAPSCGGQRDGAGRADSYVFNPHKWLFTTFDCSCFFVADRRALRRAVDRARVPAQPASESGEVVDYRDWQVPLGRRFRALKLWFVLRWYGAEGLRHHVREHVRLAGELAAGSRRTTRLELAAPADLNLVCFRHVDGDEAPPSRCTMRSTPPAGCT